MNKRYEDHDYPFDNIEEMDEDGFTHFYDSEDLHNTEFMNTNEVYPPRGSFLNIPTSEFALPGVEVEETIKAFKKLNEYDTKPK
ncbi:MAG: hypothetical protein RIN55_10535 [Tissierellaceae bacterium]|nr:hypothetical protein [Tissierellaceae bacterium]